MSNHSDSIVNLMENEVNGAKMTSQCIHFIAAPDVFGQNRSEKGSKMAPTLIKPMENHHFCLSEWARFWPHFGPILGQFWPPFWTHLGAILGPILDPFWVHFGPNLGAWNKQWIIQRINQFITRRLHQWNDQWFNGSITESMNETLNECSNELIN